MTDRINYRILAESRRLDGAYDAMQRFPTITPQAELNRQTMRLEFARGMLKGAVIAAYFAACAGIVAVFGWLVLDAIANVTADLRIIGAPQ